MTEKEKAAKGLLYDANNDPELQDAMYKTHCLIDEFNRLPTKEREKRDLLIRSILKIGKNGYITSPFFCDYGENIEIGDNFFANTNLVILDGAKVKIGDNVFIAPNVGIYTAGHPLEVKLRNKGLEYAYPVTIGNNVWIGAHACILPGVTIGDNTTIGAGSVITKDIPSNVLAAGNPCRIIRKLPVETNHGQESQ